MEAKIVFITGASSGIGEGCARKFAREGWNLILNARTVSKLEELKAELEGAYGVQVYILPFDVRDRKLAAASLESLPEEWKAIDVLVNNAGLVIGVDKEFEGSLDEWDIMIDTNIRGLLAMTRLVARPTCWLPQPKPEKRLTSRKDSSFHRRQCSLLPTKWWKPETRM